MPLDWKSGGCQNISFWNKMAARAAHIRLPATVPLGVTRPWKGKNMVFDLSNFFALRVRQLINLHSCCLVVLQLHILKFDQWNISALSEMFVGLKLQTAVLQYHKGEKGYYKSKYVQYLYTFTFIQKVIK